MDSEAKLRIKWNPIKDINKAVKDIGRSDIGKVVEAGTASLRSTAKAGEHLLKGDLEAAAGAVVYGVQQLNPVTMASNASSSVREALKHDTVNALTLGWSRDQAKIGEQGKKISYGKKVDASDWSLMGRQLSREALMAAAVIAAPAVGAGAAKAGAAISGAASQVTATGVLATAAVLKDPKGYVQKLADSYIPGSGDLIGEVTRPRTPASSYPAQELPSEASAPQSDNFLLFAGLGTVAAIGLIYLIKRRIS